MKINLLHIVAFLIVFFSQTFSFAQNAKIDSLEKLLKAPLEDTARIKTLNRISSLYHRSGDHERTMQNAVDAQDLINKLMPATSGKDQKDLKLQLANSYDNMGGAFDLQGKYPEALKSYMTSLKINEEIGNKKGIGACYNGMANIYIRQKNRKDALKAYQSALKLAEETGSKSSMATAYNNIALIHTDEKNWPEALKNHEISLKISQEINDKYGVGDSYSNIGNLYLFQKKYEQALTYYFGGLKMLEEAGAKKAIAGTYNNIGNTYSSMGEYSKAIEYMQKALRIAEEIGSMSYIKNINRALSDTYAKMDDFKRAYTHYIKYSNIKDSLLNEKTSNQITEMQTKYESEKKDKELLLKDAKIKQDGADAKQKSMQLNVVIVGFVLMILLAAFIFIGYRRKKRDKEIIEEKQREILDSIHYAKKIQRSLLPTEKYIEKAMKKLNDKS